MFGHSCHCSTAVSCDVCGCPCEQVSAVLPVTPTVGGDTACAGPEAPAEGAAAPGEGVYPRTAATDEPHSAPQTVQGASLVAEASQQ